MGGDRESAESPENSPASAASTPRRRWGRGSLDGTKTPEESQELRGTHLREIDKEIPLRGNTKVSEMQRAGGSVPSVPSVPEGQNRGQHKGSQWTLAASDRRVHAENIAGPWCSNRPLPS